MRVVTPKQCLNFEVIEYGWGEVYAVVDAFHPSGRRHRHFDAVAIWGRLWRVGGWNWMPFPGKCMLTLRQTDKPVWYRGSIDPPYEYRRIENGRL
jgi:hypothetical protein